MSLPPCARLSAAAPPPVRPSSRIRRRIRGAILAAISLILPVVPAPARGQGNVTFDGAVTAARELLAANRPMVAAELIRTAFEYDVAVRGRRFKTGAADVALATWFLSFAEPGLADRLLPSGDAAAAVADNRRLIAAIVDGRNPSPGEPLPLATGGVSCDLLSALAILRSGQARVFLNAVLPAAPGLAPAFRRCLIRDVIANLQIKVEDTGLYSTLFSAPVEEFGEDVVRVLVGTGRFAEATTLSVNMPAGERRQNIVNAIISSRQITNLGLVPDDLDRALWSIVRQRPGRERNLLGSLLALQASTKFWSDNAAPVGAFIAAAPEDPDIEELRRQWARQVLWKSRLDGAAAVWARAPALLPDAAFLIAYWQLSDDPGATVPSAAQLKLLGDPALRRVSIAIASLRMSRRGGADGVRTFKLLLDQVGAGDKTVVTALDAMLIATAARAFEKSGAGRPK